MTNDAPQLETGDLLDDRFRVDAVLGAGGMGEVYEATQISIGRRVAIKVLRPAVASSAAVQKRFLREARILSGIDHPNVVHLVDFGQDEESGLFYLAMEYVEGISLAELLERGRAKLPFALRVVRQIFSALAQAHEAGVVHRDLKPGNVMVSATAEGAVRIRVLDFGIASGADHLDTLTETGSVLGTPHYMSPEQASGGEVGGHTDVYAAGVILFEMLTGRLPFSADTPMAMLFQHVHEEPPPVRELAADVPEEVAAFTAKLLEKSPDDRPASAAEAGAEVAALLEAIDASPASLPPDATSLEAFADSLHVAEPMTEEEAFLETLDSEQVESETSEAEGETPSGPETGYPQRPVRLGRLLAALLLGIVTAGAFVAWLVVDGDERDQAMERDVTPQRSAEPSPPPPPTKPESEPEPPDPTPAFEQADDAVTLARRQAVVDTETEVQRRRDAAEARRREAAEAAEAEPAGADAAKREPTPTRTPPPTDRATLKERQRIHGAMCTGTDHCVVDGLKKPGNAVCTDQSTCVADCKVGGCIQFCQDQATCEFTCSGGGCTRMKDPGATWTLHD